MMLKFDKNVEDRKELVERLGELTGIHPVYMRTPTYAFRCGDYTVDRSGSLLVEEENADTDVLNTLLAEGLIVASEAPGEDEQDETVAEDTLAEDALAEEEPAGADAESEAEADREEAAEPEATETDLDVGISFPIAKHSGTSLRNLVNLLYSRGKLINKATDGHISVDEGLIEALKDDTCTHSTTAFREMVEEYERAYGKSIYGLQITAKAVTFTGFGVASDADHIAAYLQLASLMNAQAISQKRIQAKNVDDTNEKYAMRIWLVRMGMDGDTYKQTRKILMERLGGHTAFRTPEEAEKAKAKTQQKREALKAAKLAAQAAPLAEEQESEATGESPTQGNTAAPVGNEAAGADLQPAEAWT